MKVWVPEAGSTPASSRGAAPVGCLHELPPVELAAIVYLRAWCAGGADRRMIARDFRQVMGHGAGAMAVADFDALVSAVLGNGRRPIMRHELACQCFGGDESAFANLIGAAVAADRDEALLFSATLVTGAAAWAVVELAQRLDQVFLRLARLSDAVPRAVDAPGRRFH